MDKISTRMKPKMTVSAESETVHATPCQNRSI